ncbi:auxin-induced protein 15A-like [Typha angustifolia]|uniref:auxin-induced protein 15A-like n=1 Tax=Typha angustifolia TaxID=59011 RepID=UPI003C2DCF11
MGYLRGPKIPIFTSKLLKRREDSFGEHLRASLLDEEATEMVVPKGYLAVYVGPELKRFVIPMSYLCLPAFKAIMEEVAEEFGFEQTGGLQIPCNEEDFKEILKLLKMSTSGKKKKKKNRK